MRTHVRIDDSWCALQSFGGEDGIGGAQLFKYPSDVAVSPRDSRHVAVADTGNHR
jgi:hypothetical protein